MSSKCDEAFIDAELETNSCPICMELMEPPVKAPIMLFPCGHTFCKECVTRHTASSRGSKLTCPLCRGAVQSQAPNISLQNVISRLSAQKQEQAKQIRQFGYGSSDQKNNYNQMFAMYDTRCRVFVILFSFVELY